MLIYSPDDLVSCDVNQSGAVEYIGQLVLFVRDLFFLYLLKGFPGGVLPRNKTIRLAAVASKRGM